LVPIGAQEADFPRIQLGDLFDNLRGAVRRRIVGNDDFAVHAFRQWRFQNSFQ